MYRLLTFAALTCSALGKSLQQVLSDTPELSNLTNYLGRTNLSDQLNGLSNFTILAPNDTAFSQFMNSPEGSLLTSTDQESVQTLTALLSYHVLNMTYPDFHDNEILPTRLTAPQFTNVTGGQVVQVFDKRHHQDVFYSGLLSTADNFNRSINFTGGNLFIIDQVLNLPLNISQTAIDFNLTSAVGALTQAELVDTVDELSDVTIFVPNNTAFQSVGSALSNLTKDQLTSILGYHVINGTVGYSSVLSNGTSLQTVQGNNVQITIDDNQQIFVNSAMVIMPDILVANGVLHVIDNVLNPNNTIVTDQGSGDDDHGSPAFSGASSVSDTPFTSGIPTPTSAIPGSATDIGAQGTGASSSTSNSAPPMKTGAVGIAVLLGGAAMALYL